MIPFLKTSNWPTKQILFQFCKHKRIFLFTWLLFSMLGNLCCLPVAGRVINKRNMNTVLSGRRPAIPVPYLGFASMVMDNDRSLDVVS